MHSDLGLPQERRLGTDQARTKLPKLVDALAKSSAQAIPLDAVIRELGFTHEELQGSR